MAVEEEEITLADLFATIWRRKLMVAAITVICVVIGVLATWLPAPVYEASSVLLFPAGGGSSLAGLAQSLGISLPSGASPPIKMYRAVIESDRIRRLIAKQVDIAPVQLMQMTVVRDDAQASSITIAVRHTDPRVAQQVARLYISALATLNRELNLPLARNQVEFLEKELALRTKQLREAENQLLQFQQRLVQEGGAPSGGAGSAVSIPSGFPVRVPGAGSGLDSTYLQQLNAARLQLKQIQQQIAAARQAAQRAAKSATDLPEDLPPAADWRQKLAQLEYELRVAELTYGPDAPNVVKLKRQIDLTRQQLRKEIDNYLQAVNMNLDPNLAPLELQRVGLEAQIAALQQLATRAPEDTLKMQRLAREVATLNEIVQQLRIALEQARMEMSRDPNRWEVLEAGTLKEKPVNKRWKLNLALSLAGGVMVGTLVVLITARRTQSDGQ
ncbi:MAG: Wzz/FepE/Etk N-terminal domain-containing protein [Armatimonadota bacterium]|nr:Wzz/FepE/Etk N-terminal domain-containing protein [Armatimonadota bacterium]